jgi:mono/diheme cytochrome c family protein
MRRTGTMRAGAAAALLAGLVGVIGVSGALGEARADAVRGRVLAEQWCAQCHGVRPDDISPIPKVPTFPQVAAQAATTEMALRVFMRTSHPTMPNLILHPDDLDDIVAYILSLKPAR